MSNATQVIKALEKSGAEGIIVKHFRPFPSPRNPEPRLVWAVTWAWNGKAHGKTVGGGADGGAVLHREIVRMLEVREASA